MNPSFRNKVLVGTLAVGALAGLASLRVGPNVENTIPLNLDDLISGVLPATDKKIQLTGYVTSKELTGGHPALELTFRGKADLNEPGYSIAFAPPFYPATLHPLQTASPENFSRLITVTGTIVRGYKGELVLVGGSEDGGQILINDKPLTHEEVQAESQKLEEARNRVRLAARSPIESGAR